MGSQPTEATLLRLSLYVTIGLGVFGVIYGMFIKSRVITFDGLFELFDSLIIALTLGVARLMTREGSKRFQYGFWHLEPLVAALNGIVLLALCCGGIYISGISLIEQRGNVVSLDATAVFAVISGGISLIMAVYQRYSNRHLRSVFIRIEADTFFISAATDAAVFIGFAAAAVAPSIGLPDVSMYADASILLLLTLALVPIPWSILVNGTREILLIAPQKMWQRVIDVAEPVVSREGFINHRSYIAKTGRVYRIDIHFLVPSGRIASIEDDDRIRRDIASALAPEGQLNRWLTISFTAQASWI